MTRSEHIDYAAENDLLSQGVNCYGGSQPVSKEILLAGLDKTGIVLLRDIDPDSPDEMLRVGQMLGSINIGIDEELLGPAVMHLRYDSDKALKNHKPAYFTSDFFPLHTDMSYVPDPPRFMLLHCVHPDPEGGGISILADCNKVDSLLPDPDCDTICQPIFSFLYPPNCPEGQSKPHAISGKNLWRYKHSSMRFPEEATSAVERFNQGLSDVSIRLLLERGDLLILDNHRVVHGRTAYKHGHHELPGRHIMRLYATTVE